MSSYMQKPSWAVAGTTIRGAGSGAARVCRACLTPVRDGGSRQCPGCGGSLADTHQLGTNRRVRNPFEPVQDRRSAWVGSRACDCDGARLGEVAAVLCDPETDVVWIMIRLPRSAALTIVPGQGATATHGLVYVQSSRSLVREGPRTQDIDGYTDGPFRSAAYRHYGLLGPRRRATVTG